MAHRERLKNLRAWFDRYVSGFYGDDKFVNANLKLKHEHSRRTCKEMLYLCAELGLDDGQRSVAETVALFHDIGRFEQFTRYQTYADARSVNHCTLGVDILRRTQVLSDMEPQDRRLIEKAIEYHGRKELPRNLDARTLLFSKLIRDADKLDIFYVVTENYRKYRDDPAEFLFEIELPDEPGYSPHVVDAVLNERRTDYSRLRTLNDMKLLQLGWVYDVNFLAALRRIKQRGFLEAIVGFLPETEDIENVREKIFAYVDFRIEQEG